MSDFEKHLKEVKTLYQSRPDGYKDEDFNACVAYVKGMSVAELQFEVFAHCFDSLQWDELFSLDIFSKKVLEGYDVAHSLEPDQINWSEYLWLVYLWLVFHGDDFTEADLLALANKQ